MSEPAQTLEVRLLKAASAIYVAVDNEVADSISGLLQEASNAIAAARAEALEDAKKAIHNHEEEFNRQFSAMRSKAPDMVTDNHGWQCKYAGRCEAFGEARNAIEALKEKKP